MTDAGDNDDVTDQSERPRHRAVLPGFITEEEIGLGDLVKHAVSYVGIQPCGSCTRRAATLNRWLVFTGRHQK